MSLKPKRILVVNDHKDCGVSYTPFFSEFGEVCNDIAALKLQPFTFSLVVFTGGSDVTPELYGDTSPRSICCNSEERDKEERDIFKFAEQRGLKMTGICRGMQFLNVMSGGKMVHHLDGHNSGSHLTATKDRDKPFLTNTFHHQMCIPHKDAHILAWSQVKQSEAYLGDKDEAILYNGPEVESIYSSRCKFVGVQWHPEVTSGTDLQWKLNNSWYRNTMKDFLSAPTYKFQNMYLGVESSKLNITEVRP
jgi:gamma-glutamyl-gamma-aminobutyrate hydrolase PuuD